MWRRRDSSSIEDAELQSKTPESIGEAASVDAAQAVEDSGSAQRSGPWSRLARPRGASGGRRTFDPTMDDFGTALLLAAALLLSIAVAPTVDAWFDVAPLPDSIGEAAEQPSSTGASGIGVDPARRVTNVQNRSAAWPCDVEIDVIVNPAHGPANAIDISTWALDQLGPVSGLEFVDPRVTSVSHTEAPAGVIWIGWLPSDHPVWADSGLLGLGGTEAWQEPGARPAITAGHALLRAGAGLGTDPSDPNSHYLVMLHELIHAIGVEHVDDQDALMHESTGALRLNSTDLEAIAEVSC